MNVRGQVISKISARKFAMHWLGHLNSNLVVDFTPVINQNNLVGSYVLIHWQAKPKNLRTWGLYDSRTDSYHSFKKGDIFFPESRIEIVDIDEKFVNTVPTALIMIPNSYFSESSSSVEIE